MKTQLIAIGLLDAPHEWHRNKSSKIEDDQLRKSIQTGEEENAGAGIHQPFIVLRNGKRFLLCDGIRRMKVAGLLGIEKIPAVVEELPKGAELMDHGRLLRMIAELRQDLRPSQRAQLIVKLKAQFSLNNTGFAQYLGVDQDSITNWLAILRYIPEVVEAMDRDQLTQQAARVFDGMSEKGQRHVWKKHAEELQNSAGGKMHKELRKLYPPKTHGDFYREPDKIASRLSKKGPAARRKVAKPSFTPAEKQRLRTSFEFRDAELVDAREDLKTLKAEITAAIPLVSAIRRNENLWSLVPEEMQPELDEFYDRYAGRA